MIPEQKNEKSIGIDSFRRTNLLNQFYIYCNERGFVAKLNEADADTLNRKSFQPVQTTNVTNFEKAAQGLTIKQVLNKAASDQTFWSDLLENGWEALSDYKLSCEAKAAIISGDVKWVSDHVPGISRDDMVFLYKRLEREAW